MSETKKVTFKEGTKSANQDKPAHIMVATPAYGGNFQAGYVRSIMASRNQISSFHFLGNESLIPRGRNILVAMFLSNPDATHLMFIDADIEWPPQAIKRLLMHNKPIIGGVYPKKSLNDDYVINLNKESTRVTNGLLKVDYIGTGFMMIRRDALEQMIKAFPYLKYMDDTGTVPKEAAPYLYTLFDTVLDNVSMRYLSEDYAFCRRWKDMGNDIYADVCIPLNHYGTHCFQGNFLKKLDIQPLKEVIPKEESQNSDEGNQDDL